MNFSFFKKLFSANSLIGNATQQEKKPNPEGKSLTNHKTTYPKLVAATKRKKNKNPISGRVASTTNNYKLKRDGTCIDLLIERLRKEINLNDGHKIKVSGLSGKPKSSNKYWKEIPYSRFNENYGGMPVAQKLYKVGVDFSREALSIQPNMFRYDPETHYTKAVLEPLNKHLEGYFFENEFIRREVQKISGGLRSNGQISVWFQIWSEISAVEVFHHLPRFRTPLMKSNSIECIKIINEILKTKKYNFQSCYDDYEVQSKVFKQLEKELFYRLNIDPVKWKSQQLLTANIKKRFKNVKTEHSPVWLGQQRFDIYIPSHKVAIEYQGKQHFEPIDFFGGEDAFKETLARDKKKFFLSKKHKVHVLYWDYRNEITEASVDEFLEQNEVH
jgi:hypothetical protein